MKQAKAIIFDLDGTLVDSSEGIVNSWHYVMEKMGVTPAEDEDYRRFIGPPLHKSMEDMFGPSRAKEGWQHYQDVYVGLRKGIEGNRVYDGIFDVLAQFKEQGFKLFVGTSKFIEPSKAILERFELTHYFDGIHGSLADGSLADKGELLASVLEKENLEVGACVMIGDRRHDAIGANKVGMSCIGALWGFGSRRELEEAGVTACCETPRALADLFN